jgi:GTP:adenosylcobinamide-phosphate guanylyltransferase
MPKINPELIGTKQIAFRMTEEDYNTIKEKAKAEGLSVSKYVIDTLIKNDMREVLKKLYNTSAYNNLEKVAKESNTSIEEYLTQFNIKTKEKARELNMPLDKYIDFVLKSKE